MNKPAWVSVRGSTAGDRCRCRALPSAAYPPRPIHHYTGGEIAVIFQLVDGAIDGIMRTPIATTSGFQVLGPRSDWKAFSLLILTPSMGALWFANVYLVVFMTAREFY